MVLQRFYADNYRCLVNFEFTPAMIQLLVGGNGSGKSTVFEALDALRQFVSDASPCDEVFGNNTRTRWQQVSEQRFELDVANRDGGIYHYVLVIGNGADHRAQVRQEILDFEGKPLFRFLDGEVHLFKEIQEPEPDVIFHADPRHSGLAIVAPRPDNQKLTRFKDWLEQLRPVQINPWEMTGQSEREARYPSRHLGNFADWYRHLLQENGDAVLAAMQDLREAMPDLKALNARKAGLRYREVMARLQSPGENPVEVTLTELSEGQRCLIALYLLLHAQLGEGTTLIVDEPENFIALREIQPWLMKAISRTEDCHAQLIVASHHPELLNQLAARGAVVLTRKRGAGARIVPFPESELAPAEVVASGWEDA